MSFLTTETFPFKAHEIQKAIGEKLTFHQARTLHWQTEAARLEAEFRAKGVTMNEEPLAILSNSAYGASGGGVQIDRGLEAEWRHAAGKVTEHRTATQTLLRWQLIVGRADVHKEFELNYNDIVFFRLAEPTIPV